MNSNIFNYWLKFPNSEVDKILFSCDAVLLVMQLYVSNGIWAYVCGSVRAIVAGT